MLQSEAGYIDARPHIRKINEIFLQRTAGPYIRVSRYHCFRAGHCRCLFNSGRAGASPWGSLISPQWQFCLCSLPLSEIADAVMLRKHAECSNYLQDCSRCHRRTFTWKDYRIEGPRSIQTDEARNPRVHRFLIQVLPSGLHRIRHYDAPPTPREPANCSPRHLP